MLDGFGHASFAEKLTNAAQEFPTRIVAGDLRRRQGLRMIVRPHLQKHDPRIDAERSAELADEVHRAGTRIELLGR